MSGALLELPEEVSIATVPGLLRQGESAMAGDTLTVDWSLVTRLDSAAVSLALQWLRLARRRGVALRHANLPAAFHSLARLYGVTDFIGAA